MKRKFPYVCGIGGEAKSGKDTLCNLLIRSFASDGIVAQRFALADELKQSLQQKIKEELNIDIFNCTPEEKEIARPILVEYNGRQESKGTIWTSRLNTKLREEKYAEIAIIPDIRYYEYHNDEVPWVLNELHGTLIHIAKYSIKEGRKTWRDYVNKDEELNDPKVKSASDFAFCWPSISQGDPFTEDILYKQYKGILGVIKNHIYADIERQNRFGIN